MSVVTIHQAKTNLSRLIEKASRGRGSDHCTRVKTGSSTRSGRRGKR